MISIYPYYAAGVGGGVGFASGDGASGTGRLKSFSKFHSSNPSLYASSLCSCKDLKSFRSSVDGVKAYWL